MLLRDNGRERRLLLPTVVAVMSETPMPTPPTPLDFKLALGSFLDSEVAAVSGLEDEDGTLLPPQPPTLPLPLALPKLDLLPRLSGLLGPTEEAAAVTRREGNIDRSSRGDESPAKGDKGAIVLEGMVDRRFFPSWTRELPIFFAEIVLVICSSKLALFLFSSVRPLPVVIPTPPMVPLPTTPSTLPWPRRPPRAAMFLEILPEREEEEEKWDAADAHGIELLLLLLRPPLLDLDATPIEDRLFERTEADKSLVALATLTASSTTLSPRPSSLADPPSLAAAFVCFTVRR